MPCNLCFAKANQLNRACHYHEAFLHDHRLVMPYDAGIWRHPCRVEDEGTFQACASYPKIAPPTECCWCEPLVPWSPHHPRWGDPWASSLWRCVGYEPHHYEGSYLTFWLAPWGFARSGELPFCRYLKRGVFGSVTVPPKPITSMDHTDWWISPNNDKFLIKLSSYSSLEGQSTISALPLSPSSGLSTTVPRDTTSTIGSISKSPEQTPHQFLPRLQLINSFGAPSSWASSSRILVSSTAILYLLSEPRSRTTFSPHAKDPGRCGQLCTLSTSSSFPTSGVSHTLMLFKLHSTCSSRSLAQRRRK